MSDQKTKEEMRDDGIMYVVAGASRMGKTTFVLDLIKKAKRIIVRDPRGEYGRLKGFDTVSTPEQLAKWCKEKGTGGGKVSFFGGASDFSAFCEIAYAWSQEKECVIIAEELADVSNSGKASGFWGELVRKGLYYGCFIIAIAQRAQEIDNTLRGNATCIHTHGYMLPLDYEFMANLIGVDPLTIKNLKRGEYIQRWQGEKEVKTGTTSP